MTAIIDALNETPVSVARGVPLSEAYTAARLLHAAQVLPGCAALDDLLDTLARCRHRPAIQDLPHAVDNDGDNRVVYIGRLGLDRKAALVAGVRALHRAACELIGPDTTGGPHSQAWGQLLRLVVEVEREARRAGLRILGVVYAGALLESAE